MTPVRDSDVFVEIDGERYSRDAVAAAENAGMTPAEYRHFVRELRARPLAETFAVFALDDGPLDDEIWNANRKTSSTTRVAPGDGKPYEERLAEVVEWLDSLDRKVEIVDVTHANKRVAGDWLRRYDGDFSFLVDLKAKGGVRSDGQAKGVLNCIRAEIRRGPAAPVAPSGADEDVREIAPEITDFLP